MHGGAMNGHRQLDEAKQHFSEPIGSIEADDFTAFLQSPPDVDVDLEIRRPVLHARRVVVDEEE
jgi:hypothetical protein